MKTCNFQKFREDLLYFYSRSFPCELNVQITKASGGLAPWTPILIRKGCQIDTRVVDTVHALERRGLFYWRGSPIRDFTVSIFTSLFITGLGRLMGLIRLITLIGLMN